MPPEKLPAEKIEHARKLNLIKKHTQGKRLTPDEREEIADYVPMKAKSKPSDPRIVSSEELADWLGVTTARIRQLVDEGIIERTSQRKYDLKKCVQSFVVWQRNRLAEKANLSEGAADYNLERALLTRSKREISNIELNLLKGTVHDGEAVESYMNEMVSNFRARVLRLGNACAGIVAGISDPNACQEVIDEHAREACLELSNYDASRVVSEARRALAEKEDEEG